jgi:formylglycine-generating enzyme required for sulfatase activity
MSARLALGLACLAVAGVLVARSLRTSRADELALEDGGALPPDFEATRANDGPPPGPAPDGMVRIPGGEFSMGGTRSSEALCGLPGVTRASLPVHRVYVDGFWTDATEVTNEEFARFVDEPGYVTVAERMPTADEFPGAPPENLFSGSVVFTPTSSAVPLDDHFQWWRYQRDASWRHPEGPADDIGETDGYPVVHVA